MANYRIEAWIQHRQEDFEDQIESNTVSLLNANGMMVQEVVAFRIYPIGDTQTFPTIPSRSSTDI